MRRLSAHDCDPSLELPPRQRSCCPAPGTSPGQEEAAMTSTKHPCEHREAFAPWKPDHLYVDDSGQILCGRCMGAESTYRPWAWSDLGPMDTDRKITFDRRELGGLGLDITGSPVMTLRCEIDPKNTFTH